MLRFILDRIATATVLYVLFIFLVLSYETRLPRYAFLSAIGLSTIWIVNNTISQVNKELKISALGARAPRMRSFSPSNVGFIAQAIYYFSKHKNDQLWWKNYAKAAKMIGKEHAWTTESIVLGGRLILTADEENIKAVLATQFHDFGKGEQFQKDWHPFLGHSIFTTDGERWQNSRTLLRPQFIKDRVSDLHIFEHHLQDLLPLLKGAGAGSTVRIDDLFFRYTLDAATDFLFGFNVDSLKNADSDFARHFGQVQHTQAIIARAGPLKAFVPRTKYNESIQFLNRFTDRFIDEALALSPEELEKKTRSDEGYTFLHAIASYTRDRQILRDQIVAVLLAGRDTTAVTLSWLFYQLSTHPQVVEKLRTEIEQHVGLDPSKKPTYDDLKSMRYLQHTLNETLRLFPTVPYNVRVALKDTTLPRGGGPDGSQPIAVLKDTQVGYSTYVMQNRSDIYPPTSEDFPDYREFAPERWKTWRGSSSYIPFNAGPRICIGQQFALTEMAYTTVRILQHFSRVEDKNNGFPGCRTDIVIQPAKGVTVAFH
ncbi:hypothetical protein AMS68_000528 [Peltaster fructicola]|uniref:Uncharacterized protein n=1 Tax=Peltaster fructicola TaxID=286661 RepID=A0A6H0XK45_9PEZI|nr:hypothetical protein AMS68_000528 [Peltaster fructicola]